MFRAYNCQVVNKSSNTLGKSLVFNKPPQCSDRGAVPGVYQVPCSDCSRNYFGESGRGLNTRLKEHKYAVSRKDSNNAFYKHQKQTYDSDGTAHDINWEGARLLHANQDWHNRLIIESSLIKTFENFNGMRSTLGIDHFSAKLVIESLQNLQL